MNEYFVRSEIEYQRQRRLVAAAQYRRARHAERSHGVRSRFSAMVEQLRRPVADLPRPRHSAENGPERVTARAA